MELCFSNVPHIIFYKANIINYFIFKLFVRSKYLSFVNIFNKKEQENQIKSINMHLKEIVNDFSPYDVSVNRINKLINPSSKAN